MKNFATKIMVAMATTMMVVPAFAQEAATSATADTSLNKGLIALAAAIAIAIPALGGALAQGRAAAAALDGIARNPAASGKILIPMILGLALIESLVIYALIIALKLA